VILEPSPDGVLPSNEAGEEDRGCDTQSSERSSNQGSMAVVVKSSSAQESKTINSSVSTRPLSGARCGCRFVVKKC
jgi:hypothetical protein